MSRLRLILLSILAVSAVSAITVATASALEFFNINEELILGLLNVDSLGGIQVLTGELAGAPVKIECEHVDNHGWVHNGLLNGILTGLGLILALYLSCRVTAPAGTGCIVPNIHTLAHFYVVTINNEDYVEFTPDEGTIFASIVLEGCTNPATLSGTYTVKGVAVALWENATSEFHFKAGAPNNKLKFAGNPAEFEGQDHILMEGGGNLLIKP